MSKRIRRYLIAGLLVWLPAVVTLMVIRLIVDTLDHSVKLLPYAYRPEQLLGFPLPGLGIIITCLLLLLTGVVITHVLGEKLVQMGESLLDQIPLVRSIYQAVKQVVKTVFSSNSQAFRRVLLVEYPRAGIWSIAFQTSDKAAVFPKQTEPMLTVFIPTTPNPTSGFLMFVKAAEVRPLDISIDDALKLVISLGVMQPSTVKPQ